MQIDADPVFVLCFQEFEDDGDGLASEAGYQSGEEDQNADMDDDGGSIFGSITRWLGGSWYNGLSGTTQWVGGGSTRASLLHGAQEDVVEQFALLIQVILSIQMLSDAGVVQFVLLRQLHGGVQLTRNDAYGKQQHKQYKGVLYTLQAVVLHLGVTLACPAFGWHMLGGRRSQLVS